MTEAQILEEQRDLKSEDFPAVYHPSLPLEHHHRSPEMNLVPCFELRPSTVAMHFLAHPVADDPDAAIMTAQRIPAVIK
jgi:hypothetical protein